MKVIVPKLHEAAHDDDGGAGAFAFELERSLDFAKSFLPGRFDEAARVDEYDIGIGGIRADQPAGFGERREDALGVYLVLRTAEADYVN